VPALRKAIEIFFLGHGEVRDRSGLRRTRAGAKLKSIRAFRIGGDTGKRLPRSAKRVLARKVCTPWRVLS